MKPTMRKIVGESPAPNGKKRERPPLSEAKILARGVQGRPIEPLSKTEMRGGRKKK